jgi:hypothetical protein
MSESEAVEFLCSYPPIQSAIKLDGQGGARIQLDIPESEIGNFIKAMTWRGKRMKCKLQMDDTPDKVIEANGSKRNRKRISSYSET